MDNKKQDESGPILQNKSLDVHLSFFDRRGKLYKNSCYRSENKYLWQIWDFLEIAKATNSIPGHVGGAGKDFYLVVDVPGHPENQLRMIV